ncbi:MAG TPA: AmpG family muropeptide MFS transporter [Alphaproteobacteria bacterium]|nr:AmpG family muropeptide MFS transporter [Alphaproteobacteria bacterium]
MKSWLESLRVYREPRMLAVLFMGFSSGLPLPLTFGTLSFWLAEAEISRTSIGLFALIGISYSFKFLWSPFVDRLPLPWITRSFGRRRSWALALQALLAVAILALGFTDPRAEPGLVALCAVIVAFLSASQDIVIDAFRIELLKPEEQGAGAAATQWGYRFGMIASSAGALFIAEFGGWSVAFTVMAALMGIGMLTVWLTPEPAGSAAALAPMPGDTAGARLAAWIERAVIAPFADFMTRPGWIAILVFVVLYKFGDALAGVMANPFYVAMGFSKLEVASISKVFGVAATLAGLAVGGMMVYRLGMYQALLACGVLQAVSNLMYALQSVVGHDVAMLTVTIGLENFTGGMGSAAFVAYLSSLCNVAFTATQYALLSSLATVGRTTLSASGGWLSDQLDWIAFFSLTTAAAIPGILMVLWLMRRFPLRLPIARPALAVDD